MNAPNNPFEQAMNPRPEGANPFADGGGNKSVSLPVDLGSQVSAQNPFENAEAFTPATQTTVPPAQMNVATAQQPVTTAASAPPQFAPPDFSAEAADEAPTVQAYAAKTDEPEQPATDEILNPISAAVEEMEQKEQQSIFAKPPVFEHGSVKEAIADLNMTFEELREQKSEDFPELEDAVRVSWDVTYGKIRKTVPTPKKTKIGEFKRSIETSKEFLDALKKDKNKSPDCVIKPRITAQSKGEALPSYKGVFTSLEEAEHAGKVISIVPGDDGKVYEIRNEESGRFITPTDKCRELSRIESGFTPALPLIPKELLLQIIGFFRSFMTDGNYYEAIANILWDRQREEYCVAIPKQRVTSVRVNSDLELSEVNDSERFLHYMDVHSHNVMPARFSEKDDKDEKATRLYTVIGKLDRYIPELSVRVSNGGKYFLIDPNLVFESFSDFYPKEWNEKVTVEDISTTYESHPFDMCISKKDLIDALVQGGQCI